MLKQNACIGEECGQTMAAIPSMLDEVEKAVSSLEAMADMLVGRLHPVLEGETDGKIGVVDVRPIYSVPLVEQLSRILSRIQSVTATQSNAYHRLGI